MMSDKNEAQTLPCSSVGFFAFDGLNCVNLSEKAVLLQYPEGRVTQLPRIHFSINGSIFYVSLPFNRLFFDLL